MVTKPSEQRALCGANRPVTAITYPEPVSCNTPGVVLHNMGRKLIAAMVMLVVSATGTFVHLPASADVSSFIAKNSSHAAPVNPSHPCCHSTSPALFEIVLPPSMPCGNSCCLRPAPTNSANLPSTSRQQRPETHIVARAAYQPKQPGLRASARVSCTEALLPYAELSTVLRI